MAGSLKTRVLPSGTQIDGAKRAVPEQLETILKRGPESQRAKDPETGKQRANGL
jgi:hypothetical protein